MRPWFQRVGPPEQIGRELVRRLAWMTRGSIALLLVGHGGLGVWAAKQEWFDFLGWFGVADSSQAVDLMIWVGVFEVVLGVAVLSRPLRSLLVLVLVWKLGTELLRPLVGQPNYQFLERAGDYVLPLVLFWLAGAMSPVFRADVGTFTQDLQGEQLDAETLPPRRGVDVSAVELGETTLVSPRVFS